MKLSDLQKKIIAVHTTNILPLSAELIPGDSMLEESKRIFKISDLPNPRISLHWYLGGTVPAHFFPTEDAQNETDSPEIVEYGVMLKQKLNRKYAILTRLENLLPQMINIYASDTIIAGKYKLTNKDYLIVPKGTKIEGKELLVAGVNVIFFDASLFTLQQIVDEQITRMGGWQIEQNVQSNKTSNSAFIKELEHSGQDINTEDFFGSILEQYPSVSFGAHSKSHSLNKTAEIFCAIEVLYGHCFGILVETQEMRAAYSEYVIEYHAQPCTSMLEIEGFKNNIRLFFEWLAASHVEPEIKKYVFDRTMAQNRWINLILIEIKLNFHGYTLYGTLANQHGFRTALVNALDSLIKAEDLVMQQTWLLNHFAFNEVPYEEYHGYVLYKIKHSLANVPNIQFNSECLTQIYLNCKKQLHIEKQKFTIDSAFDILMQGIAPAAECLWGKPKILLFCNFKKIHEKNKEGVQFFKNGKYEQALNLFLELLSNMQEMGSTLLGTGEVATLKYNIGSIFKINDNYIEAIDYLESSYNIRLQLFGEKHPTTQKTKNKLMECQQTERGSKYVNTFTI